MYLNEKQRAYLNVKLTPVVSALQNGETVIFKPGKRLDWLALIVSSAILIGSIFHGLFNSHDIFGLVVIVACILFSAISVMPEVGVVTLEQTGLRFQYLLRKNFVRWEDVMEFGGSTLKVRPLLWVKTKTDGKTYFVTRYNNYPVPLQPLLEQMKKSTSII